MIYQILQFGCRHVIQCQKMPCCHGMALTLMKPWVSINTGEKTGATSLALRASDDNAAAHRLVLYQIAVFVEEPSQRVQWTPVRAGSTAQTSAQAAPF